MNNAQAPRRVDAPSILDPGAKFPRPEWDIKPCATPGILTVESHLVFADFEFTKPFESSPHHYGNIPVLELFFFVFAAERLTARCMRGLNRRRSPGSFMSVPIELSSHRTGLDV